MMVFDYIENDILNYHTISNDYDIIPNVISLCSSSDKYIYKEKKVY